MPLNVAKVVLGAFVVLWWNRRAFARALAIPFITLLCLSLSVYFASEQLPKAAVWLLYFVHVSLYTLYAVTCHRLVLLDRKANPPAWLPGWTWRESRFVLFFFAVWLVAVLTVAILMTLIINLVLPMHGESVADWAKWIPEVMRIPVMYVFARLCLVFPATAVDRKVGLNWSWRRTRKNGWRLVVVVSILPWVISKALDLLYRGDPSALEVVVLTALGFALLAVEVAALSLSYRELVRSEELAQQPP